MQTKKHFTLRLLVVVWLVVVVEGDMEATLGRCCVLGVNWAREAKGCIAFPTPVPGEPSEHQSSCISAAAICCLRFYREKQCEAGKVAAQRGQDCRLPAAEGGEYYKDCCEGCKLGLVSGSMAMSCSFKSLSFGFPWDAAYKACCSQLYPHLGEGGTEEAGDTRDNSVFYPGSHSIPDSENLCLLFPGQLCAHVCVPVLGSYTCQCRAGFTLSIDKKTCLQDQQLDRCSENDACDHICRDTGVAIECACDPGYRLGHDQRSCTDTNECLLGLHSCMPVQQVCFNEQGSYSCINSDGSHTAPWVLPNTLVPRGPLSPPNVVDVSTNHYLGGSPGRCPTGYKYNIASRVCDDVDECVSVSRLCGRDGLCTNTIGSYTCTQLPRDTCPPGYSFDMPLQSCLDINECADEADNCDREVQFCINTQGGFACQERKDAPGTCPAGYKYNSHDKACQDVDECSEGLSVCRDGEVCRNSVGAYDCDRQCDGGFQYSTGLQTCVDIDECSAGSHSCVAAVQSCVNEPGTYSCTDRRTVFGSVDHNSFNTTMDVRDCPSGYGYDFSSGLCLDIDECAGVSHNCTAGVERCINTLGAYRCRRRKRCPPGYKKGARGDCEDIDECEAGGRAVCLPGQICVNGPGRFECQVECREGFKFDPSHPLTCADVDECQLSPCGQQEACINTEGSYICRQQYIVTPPPTPPPTPPTTSKPPTLTTARPVHAPCSPGYVRPSPQDSCQDIDECVDAASRCRTGEVCINHPGGYRCRVPPNTTTNPPPQSCPRGHRFSTHTNDCQDVNECDERSDSCTAAQTCINSVGSYRCIDSTPSCSFGYRYDPTSRECTDKNECLLNPCEMEEKCSNTIGSYNCRCREGYKTDRVTGKCKDINECQLGLYECGASQRCDNTVGSYTCVRISGCGTGYTLNHNNGLCEDIDECTESATNPCRANENCINQLGGHICQPKILCGRGYRMDDAGTTCIDIDECLTGANECSGGQQCVNRQGTYTCQCPPGYRLNHHRQCQDVNECTSYYGAACSSNAACQNTPGSFICNCHDGFRKTEGGRTCVDVDECSADPNVCHHRCINVRGGYQCICNAGYDIAADNRTCVDVDECSQTRGRLCVGVCSNTPGSYQCLCPSGYTLGPDSRTCKDNNECGRTNTCRVDTEQCINTRGGHRCMTIDCPHDYVRDDTHKSRCKKRSLFCRKDDAECAKQPLSYSYNYLPLVSNMSLPSTGQVDLFTMRGPLWTTSTVHFSLDLESARSPIGVTPATSDFFRLRRTSVNQAVISLVRKLQGPQEAQLALSMKLYHQGVYSGSAVAKLLIIVSEYDY